MIEQIKKLFSENSDVSCMRLMAIVSLTIGGALAFVGLLQDRDLGSLAALCGVFVGAAFGGKVTQKFAETRSAEQEGSGSTSIGQDSGH